MSGRTRIEWATATWNPMTGCTPISEACEHCYALRMLGRNLPSHSGPEPTFHPDRLDVPLHWRKPRRIFVCSMSDLFHEAFTDEQRDQVFAVMTLASRHTFMVLTKRPGRMHRYLLDRQFEIDEARHALGRRLEATWSRQQLLSVYGRTADEWRRIDEDWPLPHVWLGVTVENQQRADERIPILLDTPAAVRFVSVEPALGAVDLLSIAADHDQYHYTNAMEGYRLDGDMVEVPKLSWVILGGETGPGARPMQPQWALDVYRQCQAAGVPFFWKQGGTATVPHVSMYMPEVFETEAMMLTREFPEVAS